jgi:hypothetical protein
MWRRWIAAFLALTFVLVIQADSALARDPNHRIDPGFQGDPGGGFWQYDLQSGSGGDDTYSPDPDTPGQSPPHSGKNDASLALRNLGNYLLKNLWRFILTPGQATASTVPRGQ